MGDMFSNLAPAIVGLAAALVGLIYARHLRREAERGRRERVGGPRPAE